MNLTECQTIDEVVEWTKNSSPAKDYEDAEKSLVACLHQTALIGARLAIEAAAKLDDRIIEKLEAKGMARENYWEINSAMSHARYIRALDAAAIVKKGM